MNWSLSSLIEIALLAMTPQLAVIASSQRPSGRPSWMKLAATPDEQPGTCLTR
jgi:hypothetical protein